MRSVYAILKKAGTKMLVEHVEENQNAWFMTSAILMVWWTNSPWPTLLQSKWQGSTWVLCKHDWENNQISKCVCFISQVDNIQEAVKTLLDKGVKVLNPEPKIGAHGKPVVFLNPKDCSGVLIELEEA